MRFREKLLALFVAVIVSVLGFNLIASSFVCLLTVSKETGYETIEGHLVKCDADAFRIRHIDDKASQFTTLSPYNCTPRLK